MVRMAVCGKGGVGKSFVVYGLAQAFLKKGKRVLVLDADESNQSLYKLFGFEAPPHSFMDFLGGKKVFAQKLREAFRKGEGEPKMTVLESERFTLSELPGEILKVKGELYLMSVGKIKEPLEGCACPMGVLGREFLEKLELKENEVLIVDTEAGIEHFGRGLEKGIYTVIVVTEPYLDALEVAEKALQLAKQMNKQTYLIVNKVPPEYRERIITFLEKKGLKPQALLSFSPEVYTASLEGKTPEEAIPLKEIETFVTTYF